MSLERRQAKAREHQQTGRFYRGNSSGSLAIFAAIRRTSSLVSSLAAERRPGSCWAHPLSPAGWLLY
jgi:hypothetical protein